MLPHEPKLRAWLARRTRGHCDIDDIVQDAYAKLVMLESVDHIRTPAAYFFQVANSLVNEEIRRSRVVPLEFVGELDRLEIAHDQPLQDEAAEMREELRLVRTAIDALPAKCREAMLLRRVYGLSQREIAAKMEISESTVEKHVSRGIQHLAAIFSRGGKQRIEPSMERNLSDQVYERRKRE